MKDAWELVHQWTEAKGLEFRLVSRMDPYAKGSPRREYALETRDEDKLGVVAWRTVSLSLMWTKEEHYLESLYYACKSAQKEWTK